MRTLIEIPNYVAGKFVTSEKEKIISDYFGDKRIKIFNTANKDIRNAKRNAFEVKEELKEVDMQKLIEVIKKSMNYYYASNEDFEIISKITGSPISFIEESIQELKKWVGQIDKYLNLCFGQIDYESIPIINEKETIGYTRFVPKGIIVGILPRNSEVEAAYLIIQALLSRTPSIIKASSSSAGPLSSIRYIEALNKAIEDTRDKELEIVKKAVSVVSIFDTGKKELIEKLNTKGGIYVIFGSDDTIKEIEKNLINSEYEKIIKMGTGLSISIVLNDANIKLAAREISSAASKNNGRDCISTNAVYVSEKNYEKFLKEINKEAQKWKATNPLDKKSVIGLIEQETIDEIKKSLKEINKEKYLKHEKGKIHLSIVEIGKNHPIKEYSGPVLLIKPFKDEEELIERIKKDFYENSIKINLATSIFTEDKKVFNKISKNIPSHIIKLNKGTEKMNMLLEHQGSYLLRDFLRKITIES